MFGRFKNLVLDWLFPKRCVACGAPEVFVCADCLTQIKSPETDLCFLCNSHNGGKGICALCAEQSFLNEIYVVGAYSGTILEKVIHSLKFNFIEELAKILANLLFDLIKKKDLVTRLKQGFVVPIPLHRRRELERGFNQSALIANGLVDYLALDIEAKLLKRIRYTTQQAKLARAERLTNMTDAFQVNAAELKDKEVFLIDDVLTTGATLNEAARVLKAAGARKVIALALAHG